MEARSSLTASLMYQKFFESTSLRGRRSNSFRLGSNDELAVNGALCCGSCLSGLNKRPVSNTFAIPIGSLHGLYGCFLRLPLKKILEAWVGMLQEKYSAGICGCPTNRISKSIGCLKQQIMDEDSSIQQVLISHISCVSCADVTLLSTWLWRIVPSQSTKVTPGRGVSM
jgi:hypothetical protein